MKCFNRDNLPLEILHQADLMPLASECSAMVISPAVNHKSSSISEISDPSDHCSQYPAKYTLTALSSDFLQVLKELYSTIHPRYSAMLRDDSIHLPCTCKKYHHIILDGKKCHLSAMVERSLMYLQSHDYRLELVTLK